MYYFVTELQKRPDGIINNKIETRSSLALGLALYYQRAAVAVTTTDYLGMGEKGFVTNHSVLNEHFDTQYKEAE